MGLSDCMCISSTSTASCAVVVVVVVAFPQLTIDQPYALQWMWPVPLLIGIYLAPESPWWLVRRERLDEAKQALLRLTSLDRETEFDADETIAMMVHTTVLEQKVWDLPLT